MRSTSTAKAHPSVVPSPPLEPTTPAATRSARYKHFARTYREFKALGGKYEVKAMFTLLDFERASVCWRTSPRIKFEDVLREEGFCTVTRYRSFKRAVASFTRKDIDKLGISAVCLIIRQPAKYREKLTREALRLRDNKAMEPTYQLTTRLIASVVPRAAKRPTYSQLRSLVEELKGEVRRLGGRLPKMPGTQAKEK